MLDQIDTTYDRPIISPAVPLKLERNTHVHITSVKMKLALHKKQSLFTAEPAQRSEEHTDLPAPLNHYLFW